MLHLVHLTQDIDMTSLQPQVLRHTSWYICCTLVDLQAGPRSYPHWVQEYLALGTDVGPHLELGSFGMLWLKYPFIIKAGHMYAGHTRPSLQLVRGIKDDSIRSLQSLDCIEDCSSNGTKGL